MYYVLQCILKIGKRQLVNLITDVNTNEAYTIQQCSHYTLHFIQEHISVTYKYNLVFPISKVSYMYYVIDIYIH